MGKVDVLVLLTNFPFHHVKKSWKKKIFFVPGRRKSKQRLFSFLLLPHMWHCKFKLTLATSE